jgi:hypothetical protein
LVLPSVLPLVHRKVLWWECPKVHPRGARWVLLWVLQWEPWLGLSLLWVPLWALQLGLVKQSGQAQRGRSYNSHEPPHAKCQPFRLPVCNPS